MNKYTIRLGLFTTDFGEIQLYFPEKLSTEDVNDFEEWVAIIIRSMRRMVVIKQETDT